MKTENELKQLLNEFGWKKAAQTVEILKDLTDTELFSRHSMGRVSGNHLSFKQQKLLESLAVLPDKQKNIYDNDDLDRTDRLILQYMKAGHTQAEIEVLLKGLSIKPNSLSIIEKRLKAIREKYNAKTNFHLAVILYGK